MGRQWAGLLVEEAVEAAALNPHTQLEEVLVLVVEDQVVMNKDMVVSVECLL